MYCISDVSAASPSTLNIIFRKTHTSGFCGGPARPQDGSMIKLDDFDKLCVLGVLPEVRTSKNKRYNIKVKRFIGPNSESWVSSFTARKTD